MKIKEYLEITKKDNDVCFDIDNHLTGNEKQKYADIESLLEDAEDVICKYRSFVSSILDKVDIEKCVGK